jgi:hypothetical protein
VSPILVRPVREQLEHDRIIRQLQAKFRRRFDVAINPGAEQNAAVGSAGLHPDLILLAQDKGRKPQAVIEVETGESVNHLEALAEWSHLARLRTSFHLYVPSGMVEVARRLCSDNGIVANEIWTYHGVGDEVRFTLVHRTKDSHAAKAPTATKASAGRSHSSANKKAARPKRPAAAARAASRPKARTAKAAKKPARGRKRK